MNAQAEVFKKDAIKGYGRMDAALAIEYGGMQGVREEPPRFLASERGEKFCQLSA